MSLAVSGHGASVAFEEDPTGAPGVFTPIPELRGDIPGFSGSRDETNATPHNDNIDSWVTGPIVREPLTFSINYIPGNTVHTALRSLWLGATPADRITGWRFWGPSGAAGVDEVIGSGEITSWRDTSPEGAGVRTAEITVRLSKRTKVDGVFHGSAS